MDATTLGELFKHAISVVPRDDAFVEKREGRWVRISSRSFAEDVAGLGEGLAGLGLEPGDRIGILSANRYHWAVADMAAITRGALSVPVYPTLPANQVAAILRDSGAKWVFASDDEQVAKLLTTGPLLKDIGAIITFDRVEARSPQVRGIDEIITQGTQSLKARGVDALDTVVPSEPDDVATIIYTSGTTGEPKGVMLTHANLMANVRGALERFPITHTDLYLSFLPLSHVFERMAGYYTMYGAGCGIAYAEAVETVAADAAELRPTILLGVPRFFEKFYARIMEAIDAAPPIRQKLFRWAQGVGIEFAAAELEGREVSGPLRTKYRIASKLVFAKLKGRIGGKVRFFVSGSAPLRSDLITFFNAVGIPVYEGYGLTETSPVVSANCPGHVRLGSVGRAFPEVQIRIAEDGEILVKGPTTTPGYYNKPQETVDLYAGDGWLQTGDIGRLDEDGYLFITDRKKDLIKTSGGKFVAPQPIENKLRKSRYIADAMLVGDQRRFVSAIILPDFPALETFARERGIEASTHEALLESREVRSLFDVEVTRANEGLARFETIKRFILLPEELTIADGSLTPSMKMKRRVIEERYRARIDEVYAEE